MSSLEQFDERGGKVAATGRGAAEIKATAPTVRAVETLGMVLD